MENWIERYVNDVTRRLPEKDREEVGRELQSNIADMLPENAGENEIKAVLYKMGSPAVLAEKYRQNPRYLISPAVYDDYVRALKWIVPVVALVCFAIGGIIGAIDAMQGGMVEVSYLVGNIIEKGFDIGVSAGLQALLWITVGFVIAERTGAFAGMGKDGAWKVEDIPEILPQEKGRISLSDSISELVIIVLFSLAAILACSGILPVAFSIQDGETIILSVFSQGFLTSCIPAIAAMALFGSCQAVLKIVIRRWTFLVCGAVVISNAVNAGIMLYLINKPEIFSSEFVGFVERQEWGDFDLMRFMGNGVPIPLVISAIVVICSIAGCATAVYKTIKTGK